MTPKSPFDRRLRALEKHLQPSNEARQRSALDAFVLLMTKRTEPLTEEERATIAKGAAAGGRSAVAAFVREQHAKERSA